MSGPHLLNAQSQILSFAYRQARGSRSFSLRWFGESSTPEEGPLYWHIDGNCSARTVIKLIDWPQTLGVEYIPQGWHHARLKQAVSSEVFNPFISGLQSSEGSTALSLMNATSYHLKAPACISGSSLTPDQLIHVADWSASLPRHFE